MSNSIQDLNDLIHTLDLFRPLLDAVERCGNLMVDTFAAGNKILTCGNGGSTADALHLAEELLGRYNLNRKPLPAISLSADASTLTCISNDFGFEEVFSRQLEALGKEGDILVGFSTSGNSKNVIRAFENAKNMKITTICAGGKGGGTLGQMADHSIIVPSENTARIQEVHTFILHQWLECIDQKFCF